MIVFVGVALVVLVIVLTIPFVCVLSFGPVFYCFLVLVLVPVLVVVFASAFVCVLPEVGLKLSIAFQPEVEFWAIFHLLHFFESRTELWLSYTESSS